MARGITNKQASYLASLQREAGEPYCGSGMTAQEASQAIDRLRRLLGKGDRPNVVRDDNPGLSERSPSLQQ